MDNSSTRRASEPTKTGRRVLWASLTAAILVTAACSTGTASDSASGEGISAPSSLPPFVSSAEEGQPTNLPRSIGFPQSTTNEYDNDIAAGLRAGAADTGMELQAAVSDGDPQRHTQITDQFRTSGVGSIVTSVLDPAAQQPGLLAAIEQGMAVQTVVMGPSTSTANAPQYEIGKALALAARDFIENTLNGKATVAILNIDSVESVRPRYQAIRDVLAEIPGANIVGDVEPATQDSQAGYETTATLLQKDPQIDVVLGEDYFGVGALAAMQSSGRDLSRVFIGGTNASNEPRDNIAKGTAYRAVVSTSPAIMAYSMARHAADWVDGKAIPQGMCIVPLVLDSPDAVTAFENDMNDLKGTYENPQRLSKYLTFLGSISYETRDQWFTDTWTPTTCSDQ
ncbi:sugar ABC transporter substrate-binding protein [Rhodococcus sp. BP-260]|uniref:sugar ABC transporter substrate-binding protein n=1 Tax=Rhodococcus sp. BP-260 TaxID=2739486 RepID=UPI0021C0790E|nr:sugar ABC transporter substrate-binding protein [Rhodococcus sp. BP-260]